MTSGRSRPRSRKPHLWIIRVIGVIVPRRLRADWRQEWEAELKYRETLLADWDILDRRKKLDLFWHSLGAFMDALWLQPKRLEDEMIQDLRYGLRMLRQRPGFTLVAVIALALGIGANTAIFSIINAVLLRPLPFSEPDRLMIVWQTNQQARPGNHSELPFAYPNYDELQKQCKVCEEIGAWNSGIDTRFALTGGEHPEEVQYAVISASLFSALGVKPALGRAFLPEEDQLGAARVAIISHGLWQRRWSGDRKLLGQPVIFNGQSYTLVGIMPPRFVFPRFPRDAEVWIPFSNLTQARRFSPGTRSLNVIAKLKAGATITQAEVEMETIARRIEQQDPQFNRGLGLRPIPLHQQLTGHLRLALFVLFGAVGFVLLIACANIANLLLARASTRRQEIAVRLALGATRLRLARQLLTESSILALLGGAVGLLLAKFGISLLSIIPYNAASYYIPYNIPHDQITLDGRVFGFTFALSLLAGMIFGLAPAFQSSRPDLNTALKTSGGSSGSGPLRQRTRSLLVVVEVALSLILLVGAGLMIKSFMRLHEVDPGFEPKYVLTAEINLPGRKYPDGQKVSTFHEQLLERLAAMPGVEAVGLGSPLPLSGTNGSTAFFIDGQPVPEPRDRPHTHPRTISPAYFRAMGMRVIEGRAFTEQDNAQAPRVAIINETMARRFWPAQAAIGKGAALDFETMKFFPDRPPLFDRAGGMREIVGIVRDVRHEDLETEPRPEMYIPDRQRPERGMSLVIRSEADPGSLATAVRDAVSEVDPDQPVANVKLMSQMFADSVAKPRFNYLLLTIFAAVALILSATGIYGVMSYAVTARTREMGIRLALGAQAADVLKMVILQGMRPVIAGIVLGLAGTYALTRVMVALLFHVSPTDRAIFAGVAALLALVALLACCLPARRATKVDPVMALRDE
jgi:putative ABC transport system permease protein